jgi:FecR protein
VGVIALVSSSDTGRAVTVSTDNETLTVQPGQTVIGTVQLVPNVTYHAVVSGSVRIETPRTPNYELHDAFYCYETNSVDSATNHCVASGTPTEQTVSLRSFQGQGSPNCASSGSCALGLSCQKGLCGTPLAYQASHTYETDFQVIEPGKLRLTAELPCNDGTARQCVSGSFTVEISQMEKPHSCKAPWAAGDLQASRPAGDPQAHPAALNEVHVVAVCPDVQFHKGGTPADAWLPMEKDTVLKAGDEISCDPDGSAVLAFADNSTVTVSDTTQLKIGSFFTEGGVVRTEILLKMGKVAALVNKSEATKSDFRIKSPTAVASVRGTIFTAFYDPGSGAMLVSTQRGAVAVAPSNPKLRRVTVGVGREVSLTPRSESPVARTGKAGLRGGDDVLKARDLVMKLVATRNRACSTITPRGNAFSVNTAPGGWLVTVKLQGGLSGQATFQVKGNKVTPVNPLARKLARGCH